MAVRKDIVQRQSALSVDENCLKNKWEWTEETVGEEVISDFIRKVEACGITYCSLEGEWTEVAQLIQPASSVSATALGDRIFIYGGEKSDRTDSCVVQCYDSTLRTVTVVASLPVNCKLSRAVMCDNDTYLILFDGKVIKHSPDEGSTKIVGQIKNFDRVHFGLVHRRGILYVLGGQKVGPGPSRALCDAMIKFDTRNNVAMTIPDRVPTPRLLDSCAKITIDKKFLQKDCLVENPSSPS